jgi:transmembrane sensor
MHTLGDDQTLEQAARWRARLASPDCTETDRRNFRRWQVTDQSHARAYAAMQGLADSLALLVATDPRLAAMADKAYVAGARRFDCAPAVLRRAAFPLGLAASILIAFLAVRFGPAIIEPVSPAALYVTAPGEQRQVVLDDGSVIHLDVDSRIDVRMTKGERRIELRAGRALFEVAHDASRPFTVSAGNGRVVALGTRFQVLRADQHVVVTLAEGSVAVSRTGPARAQQDRLHPGEELSFGTDTMPWVKRAVDPAIATSWSRGRLIFRSTPLAEALEEINRYAVRKVRLGDPCLARLAVAGNFIAGDSKPIVDALAAVLPLRVVEGSGNELVLFPRYAPPLGDRTADSLGETIPRD